MKPRIAAGALALGLLAAACGSDAKDSSSATTKAGAAAPTTAAAAPTTAAAAPTTGGGEVRWRTRPDNQAEADLYRTIGEGLVKEKKISSTLKYEPGDNEGSPYQDKLRTELASGTAPDVFWIPGTDVADFVTKGLIMDLRSMAKDSKVYKDADFYPEPMFHLTFDPKTAKAGGPLWGVPRDVSTFAIYLNQDLIAKSGAENPIDLEKAGKWDWAALKRVSDKIASAGGATKGWGMSGWWANYGVFMNAAGGGFFNADRTACGLDSDGSIAGLTYARSLYEGTSSIPYGDDPEKAYNAGTLGMFMNGRWATPGARKNTFNWDVVGVPTGAKGPGNWLFWGAYVVNAKAKNPKAAWELVEQLTTAETQGKISELGANIPSRVSDVAISKFLTFSPPKNNQAFINGLKNKPTAEGPLWKGSWPAYDKAMNTSVEAVLKGSKSVADFKSTICNDTKSAFTA